MTYLSDAHLPYVLPSPPHYFVIIYFIFLSTKQNNKGKQTYANNSSIFNSWNKFTWHWTSLRKADFKLWREFENWVFWYFICMKNDISLSDNQCFYFIYSSVSYKVQLVSVCLADFVLIKLKKAINFFFINTVSRR